MLYMQPDFEVTETGNTNVWQRTNVWQIEVRTTERYIADADPQIIIEQPNIAYGFIILLLFIMTKITR